MKDNSNKGLIVLVVVLVVCIIGLASFIIYDKYIKLDNTNNDVEKEVEETGNSDNDKEIIKSIVNDSNELNELETNQFLNNIVGDYLSKNNTGILISFENNKYYFLNYKIQAGSRNSGEIIKVRKNYNKYILTVHFEGQSNEAIDYPESIVNYLIDVQYMSMNKIILEAIIDDTDILYKNGEYIKFNGDFYDWDSKSDFIKSIS